MRKLDSSTWKGEAAEHLPREVRHASRRNGCTRPTPAKRPARALDFYADTVNWAQGQARDAIDLYRKGKKTSEQAAAAHEKRIDAYTAAIKAGQDPGPSRSPSTTPARPTSKRPQILAEARRQRNEAGRLDLGPVKAALAHAPAEPPPLDRLRRQPRRRRPRRVNTELTHVVGGAVKGTAGLVNFVRGLNPLDPYNLTHPAAYLQNVSMTLSGSSPRPPTPNAFVRPRAEGFKKDPSEFFGRLIPELIGTKGAGMGRTAVRTGLKEGLENSATHMASNDFAGAKHPGVGAANSAPKDWSDLARSTEHVSEKSIHYDSVDPHKAQEFLDDQYPWLKDVNNQWEPGYTENCSHNTVTVDRRLDDIEVSAAPKQSPIISGRKPSDSRTGQRGTTTW